jgi:hypothetical protein
VNIGIIASGVANALLLLYHRYKSEKNKMIEKTFMDKELWNNDYPIVLVHGYCGSTLDENWILNGYFHYAFSHISRLIGVNEKGEKMYLKELYEADVSPVGSVHDRACELY